MNATFWRLYLPVVFVLGGLAIIAATYRPLWLRRWRVRQEVQRLERERQQLDGAATAQDRFIRRLH